MKTSAAAPLRVLIVDDARLARAELRTLLAQIELVELVPDGAGGWLERPASIALEDQ